MMHVISDIHGNLKLFNEILRKIDLKDRDGLYVLGDMMLAISHGCGACFSTCRMNRFLDIGETL